MGPQTFPMCVTKALYSRMLYFFKLEVENHLIVLWRRETVWNWENKKHAIQEKYKMGK